MCELPCVCGCLVNSCLLFPPPLQKFNDCDEIGVKELASGINVSDTEIVRHLFPLVHCLKIPLHQFVVLSITEYFVRVLWEKGGGTLLRVCIALL